MHGSWGNLIKAEEAFEQMGADVMRWQFCAQPPDRNLLFGYGPAHEVKRRLLTLWNSVRFLVDYGNIEGFRPRYADLDGGPDCELLPMDRWLVARTGELVVQCTSALDGQLTHRLVEAFEAYVDDLSNWYIRRSRRRFYAYDEAAFRTLWFALVQALRVAAPVMPFLAEHLWQNLARDVDGAPDSVHLAGWPEPAAPDVALLAEFAEVRRVVALGHQARAQAGVKLRQPLSRLQFDGAPLAALHLAEIEDELRVKEARPGFPEARARVKPNLPVLGPRLGKRLREVQEAMRRHEAEPLPGGSVRVLDLELAPEEVIVEGLEPVEGSWIFATEDGVRVALDPTLDAELEREGRLLDLVRAVNLMRREAGLEITDRIRLRLPRRHEELREFEGRIGDETLAVAVEFADVDEPELAKA